MDEFLNNQEPETYQTGRTSPKKRRYGVLALILVVGIFLGGIACAVKFTGLRLFWGSRNQDGTSLSFLQENETIGEDLPDTENDAISRGDWSLTINAAPQAVDNIPQEGGLSLQEIYEKNIASVVSISCAFRNGTSTGTGIVLSQDGFLVTNCHVVEDARQINVLFTDGRTLSARVVGLDQLSDLAVLKVEATDLIAAEFGDSATLRVGDSVAAIGDPLGIELRGSLTNGIISAINRDISTGGRTMTLIQTNAALNEGNSGGPLLNCYGQVIGINTLKIGDYMSTSGVEGLGFAIPSSTVKEVVEQLLTTGYISGRPTLGITGETVSVFQQIYAGLPKGVYITDVEPDSAAADQGLVPGDILLSVNGTRITDTDGLDRILYNCRPGDALQVVLYRSGKQYMTTLTVDELN
ncbi:MAG: trypsin-like peptidase domain-containing protein [Oscillospiraceae bacterium]|nr:trypsin-like peptidase domain-containing protein [Oscillospiraceae bacterium]MBQ7341568.1 trypsin-like peptidase domain-containing protein [Oscillospiraceae bacterium]